MDNVDLKIKSMVTVMQPIAKQVLLCSSSKSVDCTEKFSDVCHKIKEACSALLQDANHGLDSNNELRAALQDFHTVQSTEKFSGKNVQVCERLLLAVHDILVRKDLVEVVNISAAIEDCQTSLVKLMESTTSEDIEVYLKNFVMLTSVCMDKVGLRAHDLVSKKQQQVILLCASQIAKCLHWLRIALIGETDDVKLLKCYVYNCISWCFSELKNVVQAPKPSTMEESEGCGGQFVHRMDLALELLSSCSGKLPEVELKSIIDEVLCHAMSIAQVAVSSDCKIITASCQKVLRALEVLKKEFSCSEGNPSVCNLYVNSLADSLEALEQRVNTALLRLVLEVFCDFNHPLNALLNISSSNDVPECDRQCQDLDEMIAVFDLQMDRIMQIGLFAMACSEDVKRVLGIRSCLASLESLEPELIPAVTAYYLEPTKVSCVIYLRALWLHWASEVGKLAKLIDGIVDPAAFCQVTLDDVHVLVAKMKSKLNNANVLYLKETNSAVCNRAKKLLQHLKISIADVDQQNIPPNLPKIMNDFQLVCNECDAARHSMLSGPKDCISSEACSRVLKRCELLVSVLKKLQPLLVEMMNSSEKEYVNVSCKSDDGSDQTGESLQFPESVNDLPVDEDSCSTSADSSLTGKIAAGDVIAELMKRGKLLSKERSILYFTPKRKEHFNSNLRHASVRRTHCRPINYRCSSEEVQSDSVINQTLRLEITSILDKLTFLSDTLTENNESVESVKAPKHSNSTCNELPGQCCEDSVKNSPSCSAAAMPSGDGYSIVSMESRNKMMFVSTMSASSLTSHEVNTPQRMQDLQAVQDRIAALMEDCPIPK